MKRWLFFAVGLATAAAQAQDLIRLAQIADAKAQDGGLSGAVLVAKDDQVVFEKCYGFANAEWKIANTPETKFRIGSVSKQFTAACILLLEERGKLSTDDPVAKYVLDAPSAWEKITLFHLLTHTSGIPNFTSFPEYKAVKLLPKTPTELIAVFRDKPLNFAPGEKGEYSNSNYILLSYIIEKVSSQPYERFIAENVFTPLGMSSSGYDVSEAILPSRASGYTISPEGLRNAPYVDMHVPLGAGGLYSTTHDLHRWNQALHGGKLLQPASYQKMTTAFKNNYAFGLVVNTVKGHRMIEHGGGIEGFNAELVYYPESKLSIVILTNVNGSAPFDLSPQLAAVMFGETVMLPSERAEVTVPVEVLKNYVGVYQLLPNITNTIRLVDGRLTTQLSGQVPFPIFAESTTKFFLKYVDAQVEFVTNDRGEVVALIQRQAGKEARAPKISSTAP